MLNLLLFASLLTIGGGALVLATIPLDWQGQLILAAGLFVIATLLNRIRQNSIITLVIIGISIFITVRYGYWRATETLGIGQPEYLWINLIPTILLFISELYAILILFLGYIQTAWPLQRKPVPIEQDPEDWPDVDVFVPTYNEPLDVVRPTVMAALQMDWPTDKLHIWLLDDGRRDEFKAFAEEIGVNYVRRDNNAHAKAGNLNHAIKITSSKYIAIFDCDHIPVRSFLQLTVGFMEKDPGVALVQTPHHFYSPDPFERNLKLFRKMPNEGELFYGIVQDGNDLWDATFFCGSCALLRREAIEQIGGIAVETVTEDAHTSLRMHAMGWKSVYMGVPQAAGLATENLASHIGQRIRWARGMVQIFRTDNPLFKRGLKFGQRLCYANAMLHFMHALPRLVFLTAPLLFLLLDMRIIDAFALTFAAYALPHLFMANLANSRIQGRHRFSFWNEVYETALAPYIFLPTLLALINPKLGKFNVTAKGGYISETHFDGKIARPYAVLWLLNLAGLIAFAARYAFEPDVDLSTLFLTGMWTVYNFIVISAVIAVAHEQRQIRRSVRIPARFPATISFSGRAVTGHTEDVSNDGARIRLDAPLDTGIENDQIIMVKMHDDEETYHFPARVIGQQDREVRLQFTALSTEQQLQLVRLLYTRADAWIGWGEANYEDKPFRSLMMVVRVGLHGANLMIGRVIRPWRWFKRDASTASLFLIAGLGAGTLLAPLGVNPISVTSAQTPAPLLEGPSENVVTTQAINGAPASLLESQRLAEHLNRSLTVSGHETEPTDRIDRSASLLQLGHVAGLRATGINRRQGIEFRVPQDHLIREAELTLDFLASPALSVSRSQFSVLLNGSVIATRRLESAIRSQRPESTTVALNPLLIREFNNLVIDFVGVTDRECHDPADPSIWLQIQPSTTLKLNGTRLPLASQLARLPAPFMLDQLVHDPDIPMFVGSRAEDILAAAGIITSWFGSHSDGRGLRFPLIHEVLPAKHSVIVADTESLNHPALVNVDLPQVDGPTLAVRDHPVDRSSKLLLVLGRTPNEAKTAAQALATNRLALQGSTLHVREVDLPPPSAPGTAPRWLRTDRAVRIDEIVDPLALQVAQSGYVSLPLVLPPDLFWWERDGIEVDLAYTYNPTPIGPLSSIAIKANQMFSASLPMPLDREQSLPLRERVTLPAATLRPQNNEISFFFDFQVPRTEECGDRLPQNIHGALLGSTTFDLRGVPRYVRLPDLGRFVNGALPYSLHHDFHASTVVLDPASPPELIAAYLSILGHIGAQTGSPSLQLSVTHPDTITDLTDSHLLWFAPSDQRLDDALTERMPVRFDAREELIIQDIRTALRRVTDHLPWWGSRPEPGPDSPDALGRIIARSDSPTAVLQQFMSPYGSGNIVTLFTARDEAGWRDVVRTIVDPSTRRLVYGDVTLFGANSPVAARSFVIDAPRTYFGSLDPLTWVRWHLSRFSLGVVPIVVFLAMIQAVILAVWLRRRAQLRQKGKL
ncbi:MAG: UDP-forming cellulose synthase catalytic subunit [Thioalkalivibrionaceae bacterium]